MGATDVGVAVGNQVDLFLGMIGVSLNVDGMTTALLISLVPRVEWVSLLPPC